MLADYKNNFSLIKISWAIVLFIFKLLLGLLEILMPLFKFGFIELLLFIRFIYIH